MSLLVKVGGITKLSELTIDADKNWQAMGISNVKELAAGMARGDLLARGLSILQRLQPSTPGYVLTSAGPLHIPSWQPPAIALEYYIPVPIDLTHAEAIVAPDDTHNVDAPIASAYVANYLDDVAHNLTRLDRGVTLVDAEDIVVPDETHNIDALITGVPGTWEKIVDGAVKEDTPAQADDTANAQSAAANDMELLPAAPAVDDAYYVGFAVQFDIVLLQLGVSGVGNWATTEEYWDGLAWTALADVVDGTAQFMAAPGLHATTFTRPGDWALTNVAGVGNLYWMRYRVSAFVNIVTQPWGTQAWCEVKF